MSYPLGTPQAQRTLKFITTIACTSVGISSILFSDFDHIEGFEGKPHVFTGIQQGVRSFMDETIYGIDIAAVALNTKNNQQQHPTQHQHPHTNTNTNTNTNENKNNNTTTTSSTTSTTTDIATLVPAINSTTRTTSNNNQQENT